MVAPMEMPRRRVTTLAISFSEALVRRLTTPDSRMRFPSMIVPIRGGPLGAIRPPKTSDHEGEEDLGRLGNRLLDWYLMTIIRSFSVVRARMMGG